MKPSREKIELANSPIIDDFNYKVDKCALTALDEGESSITFRYEIGGNIIAKAILKYEWDAATRILTVSECAASDCKLMVTHSYLPESIYVSEEKEAEFRAKMARLEAAKGAI